MHAGVRWKPALHVHKMLSGIIATTGSLDGPAAKLPRLEPAGSLVVKRLSEHAKLPVRGSPLAAGYDLSAAHACVVPARGKALIKTDLAMIVPEGCYGRIAPRSGLAWKHFIDTGAGVIDADYRGNVGVRATEPHAPHRCPASARRSPLRLTADATLHRRGRAPAQVVLFNHAESDFKVERDTAEI